MTLCEFIGDKIKSTIIATDQTYNVLELKYKNFLRVYFKMLRFYI